MVETNTNSEVSNANDSDVKLKFKSKRYFLKNLVKDFEEKDSGNEKSCNGTAQQIE